MVVKKILMMLYLFHKSLFNIKLFKPLKSYNPLSVANGNKYTYLLIFNSFSLTTKRKNLTLFF